MGLDEHSDIGIFFLRLGIGGYLIWEGGAILWNPDIRATLSQALGRTPLVAGPFAGQAVTILLTVYILLGTLLVLGLFTRAAALILGILSLVTLTVVNWHLTLSMVGSLGLLNMGKEVVVLSAAAGLFFTGGKKLCVDNLLSE